MVVGPFYFYAINSHSIYWRSVPRSDFVRLCAPIDKWRSYHSESFGSSEREPGSY